MKKIVIIPDSFKNTMSSTMVCDIINNALYDYGVDADILMYPIADGGEGTCDVLSDYWGLQKKRIDVANAYGEMISVEYGCNKEIAIFDVASIVGFEANSNKELNPEKTTTYGIGKMISFLLSQGIKKIYIGLGGSITNDLGCGMLSALGIRFLDKNSDILVPTGETLKDVVKIYGDINRNNVEFVCLSDVKSRLLGSKGAAKMFARQKGADEEMIERLEKNTKAFIKVVKERYKDYSKTCGAGAAGGLGYAFKTFLNARMVSGINAILNSTDVLKVIDDDTIVITGEGKFDKQSLNGKVIGGILSVVKKRHAKMVIVAGCQEEIKLPKEVIGVFVTNKNNKNFEEVKKSCVSDLKETSFEVCKYLIDNGYIS